MQLRPYQEEAVAAVYDHLRQHDDNPCVVLPTGTGKSLVLARIATDAVQLWSGRVLILAHVKELLEQNADKIQRLCPDVQIGVYSAGLNRRDTDAPVLVAGIQSVYNRACDLGAFDLIIVDEAHLLPADGEGMYRTFLAEARVVNPNVRVIGLTATPYRLKGGVICQPENILNTVCYEAGLREMIVQGYLSPLKSRGGSAKADLTQVHVRGGEFVASEMATAMDQAELVTAACQEIVDLTRDRTSVLIFTASVAHCEHVAREIEQIAGKPCGVVTGGTPADERAEILARFRGEDCSTLVDNKPPLKYLANVNVLTTGFDATNIDCIVLLRGTMSTGLYVQMVGRGTRLHPGKEDCLVLDYGGNVLRHGPVDAVQVQAPGESSGGGEAPAKECPKCQALITLRYQTCPECGYEWPPPEAPSPPHARNADGTPILSGESTDDVYSVWWIGYNVHRKKGADDDHPRTMKVAYYVGSRPVCEWVCPEHSGYARSKFVAWWGKRCNLPPPKTAEEAVRLANDGALAEPTLITVRSVSGERFDRVVGYELGPVPDYCPEPGWNDPAAESNGYTPDPCIETFDDIPF